MPSRSRASPRLIRCSQGSLPHPLVRVFRQTGSVSKPGAQVAPQGATIDGQRPVNSFLAQVSHLPPTLRDAVVMTNRMSICSVALITIFTVLIEIRIRTSAGQP